MCGKVCAQLVAPWIPCSCQHSQQLAQCIEPTPEMNAADIGAVVEAKNGSGLVQGDVLGKPYYILVESTTHKLELGHYQC